MQTPHKCPICDGTGKVRRNMLVKDICPACHGRCIVWGPEDSPQPVVTPRRSPSIHPDIPRPLKGDAFFMGAST